MKFSSVNNFDLLRLLAATQVVIAHGSSFFVLDDSVHTILKFFVLPFPGVPIFFVISGFLITASWLRPNQTIRSYTYSRFLRIYPALWLAVILAIIIVIVTANSPSSMEFFAWVLSQATLLQVYNPDFLRGFGVGVINGSLWTIPVEICFYIFVPIFFLIFRAGSWRCNVVLMLLLLFSFCIYVVAYDLKNSGVFIGKLISLTIFSHLWQFLMGVFIYLHFEKLKYLLVGRVVVWFCLYFISLTLYKVCTIESVQIILLLTTRLVMAFFVISFAFSYTNFLQTKTRWLTGDYSYGTYLFHALWINLFVEYNFNDGLWALSALLLLTYLTAYLSWKLVELPALSMKRAIIKSG